MRVPNEIVIQTLENLDFKCLLMCMQVSTNFRDLIGGTASLQYIIELAVSGQQDGWRDPMATSEDRLNRLREHREIPMNDGGLWALSGGVLSYENQKGEEKTWTLGPDFGCTIEDFSMDPYQDLLVLVEPPQINGGGTGLQYIVHLRSLTTGEAHPLAKDDTLSLPLYKGRINVTANFLLAVLYYPELRRDNQVGIWEWKTGRLLLNIVGEGACSFSLLSYRYIALAIADELGNPLFFGRAFRYPPLAEDAFLFSFRTPELLLVVDMQFSVNNVNRHGMHSYHLNIDISYRVWYRTYTGLVDFSGHSNYTTSQREIVTSAKALHGKAGFPVQLYDFNTLALRRDSQTSVESEGPGSVQHLASHTHVQNPFSKEIVTKLPYWENFAWLENENDWYIVMCSEDNIVIVDRQSRTYRILVF
ncbi:hypothetical protein BJ912DRAFT_1001539 [Pholiota molesta]|nr:hypothetical protein BJ912DRAFT_1001539 [Pholiota molesta]